MTKKAVSLLLAVLLIAASLPLSVQAADQELILDAASSLPEQAVAEEVDEPPAAEPAPLAEDGFEINGDGVLTKYTGPGGDVVIPGSVTSIGEMAFLGCADLTSVTIPNSVTSIGLQAFSSCTALESVTIPDSVTSIGGSAFYSCTSLVSAVVPGSVASMDSGVFSNCTSLASVTLQSGLTEISRQMFRLCSSLTSVTIPEGVTSIGENAFNYCSSLESVVIPDSVASIGSSAFSDCSSLAAVTLPSGLADIESRAFYKCSSLAGVAIPASVANIGDSAFGYCSNLASVTIPDGVGSIGSEAFYNCYSLTSATIPASVASIGSSAFSNCSSLAAVTLLDGVASIGEKAFSGCILESVDIPGSVASIGAAAFYCESLQEISVAPGNGAYCSVDGVLFTKDMAQLHTFPAGKGHAPGGYSVPNGVADIGGYAFAKCDGLTEIVLPGTVTAIGDFAFAYCTALTGFIIPDAVATIGDFAFSWCHSLTEMDVPDGVTRINEGTFNDCRGLLDIHIPDSVTYIGKSALSGCQALTKLEIPKQVAVIETDAFNYLDKLVEIIVDPGNPYYCSVDGVLFSKDMTFLHTYPLSRPGTSYAIPDTVTQMNTWAFEKPNYLTSLTLPSGLESISNWAGKQRSYITELTIPAEVEIDNVERLRNLDFIHYGGTREQWESAGADLTETIVYCADGNVLPAVPAGAAISGKIGDSVTWELTADGELIISGTGSAKMPPSGVGSSSWYPIRYSIRKVTVMPGITELDSSAFAYCVGLEEASIPNTITEISGPVFGECASLTTLHLPDSLTTLGNGAFLGCSSLAAFEVGPNVTEIKGGVFFESGIQNFTVAPGNTTFTAVDGVLYADGGKTLLAYPCGRAAESFTIPSTVTKIAEDAFNGAHSLKHVTIPNSVTTIEAEAFRNSGLVSVAIPDSVTQAGLMAFADSDLESVTFGTGLTETANSMFLRCHALREISFPSAPLKIGKGAFSGCTALGDVTLHNVTYVDRGAFSGCYAMRRAVLPRSVQYVHSLAFMTTTRLVCENPDLSPFGTYGYARIQTVEITGQNDYDEAYEILALVNQERAKAGAAPLQMDKGLLDIAMQRAAETSVLYAHTRPDGSHLTEMAGRQFGENIMEGVGDAEYAMDAWMNSEGHKANILNDRYKCVGIGCFKKDGVTYWAQNFGLEEAEPVSASGSQAVTAKVNAALDEFEEAYMESGMFGPGKLKTYTIEFFIHLDSDKLAVGEDRQASVIAVNSGSFYPVTIDNTGCVWSSSDASVAAVDANGKITGIKDGTATITMKLGLVAITKEVAVGGAQLPDKPDEPGKPCDGGANCPSRPFVDLNTKEWYHEYTDYVLSHGIFNGNGTDKNGNQIFSPNGTLTRAMLAQILYNLEGRPAVSSGNSFSDVAPKEWYANAIAWASKNNLVAGYGNDRFGPNDPITREQMAALLYRYAGFKGYSTSNSAGLDAFPDAGSVSGYAVPALRWAVAEKLINGSGGKLIPLGNATRAEASTILTKFCQNIGEEPKL